jgi:hypothetical protein
MIRDGILESEAVLSLPVEARWLYVTILLSADDVGLFEATPFKLARIADVRRELADRLMAMLADSDLVRLYEVNGKRYGFIPRFGQRLQIKRIKHAAPPDALLSDEPDTLKKIKDLALKTTVDHGCASAGQRKTTAAQQPEPEPEPEPEVEGKKKEKEIQAPRKRSTAPSAPDGVSPQVWSDWLAVRKSKKAAVTDTAVDGIRVEAIKAGMTLQQALETCCRQGWAGFKAAWVADAQGARQPPRQQSIAERDAEVRRMLGIDAMQFDVIEGGGYAR